MYNILLLFGYLLGYTTSQACSGTVTRMEIRQMSASQLSAYATALKTFHATNNDLYTPFTANHNNNANQAHGVAAFFPWHRYFLRQLEIGLQKINPNVILPYWDWTIDSQAPERSPVLSSSMFGGNGAGTNRCVTNGLFSGWQASFPSNHCLRRQYSGGSTIPAFYSATAIESLLSQSRTYDQLRRGVENGPHGVVHTGIGGNSGDLSFMYSPNDPLFYAHHTFVDLLWNEWQKRNPTLANSYNGGSVSTSNTMVPFNVPVSTVLSTNFGCYNYPRWSGRAPPPVTSTPTSTTRLPTSTNSSTPTFPTFNFPGLSRRQFDSADIDSSGGLIKYIENLVASVPKLIKIDPNDRSTSFDKIRTPAPLPEDFISMNNLNLNEVRANESMLANLVEAINALAG